MRREPQFEELGERAATVCRRERVQSEPLALVAAIEVIGHALRSCRAQFRAGPSTTCPRHPSRAQPDGVSLKDARYGYFLLLAGARDSPVASAAATNSSADRYPFAWSHSLNIRTVIPDSERP